MSRKTHTMPVLRTRGPDTQIELRAEQLPPGVAGRLSGIALTFDQVDTYGTMFAPGSATRSIKAKVAARKLPLMIDHSYETGAHVGVVTAMQELDGGLLMTADLFDTPAGRAAREYAQAVIAAGASTGFSIGFVPRQSETVMVDGRSVERFTEIELREVSLTPMPSVPGTDLIGARHDGPAVQPPVSARTDAELLVVAVRSALDAMDEATRVTLLDELFAAYRPADATRTATTATTATAQAVTIDATVSPTRTASAAAQAPSPDVPVVPPAASMQERMAALRGTYAPI